jgi:hypothetical protein
MAAGHAGSLSLRIIAAVVPYTKLIASLRGPLVVGVAALVLLGLPDQVQEMYVALALDAARAWPQAVLAVLALAALSIYLGTASQALLWDEPGPPWLLRAVPILAALLPLAGAVIGIEAMIDDAQDRLFSDFANALAKISADPQVAADVKALPAELVAAGLDAGSMRPNLRVAEVIVLLIALAVLAFHLIKAPASVARLRAALLDGEPFWRRLLIVSAYIAVLMFAAQSLNAGAALAVDFTLVPRTLGPLAILCFFLTSIAAHLVAFTRVYAATRFPAIAVLAVAAVGFSALNLNDNHRVRVIPQHKPPPSGAPGNGRCLGNVCDMRAEFDKWWAARPEMRKAQFRSRGQAYPVFIAASQGGGIFAAHLAAITLARLYDRCPALQHHIFAVSSVSGGSVGSGLVAALLAHRHEKQTPEERRDDETRCDYEIAGGGPGPIERQARSFLADDFLSPVGAAGLFPDFLARFLPVALTPLDRARAFDASFEQSWARRIDPSLNLMREGFLRLRDRPGGAPMLILNTTEVDTGLQIFIAPATTVPFRSIYATSPTPHLNPYSEDLPLSTAVGVSARFPIVTPAATFAPPGMTATFRHVDGGIFENSGVETALSLIEQLEGTSLKRRRPVPEPAANGPTGDAAADRKVFKVLALSESPPDLAPWRAEGLAELLSPARALYRARVQRGQLAVSRAQAQKHWIVRVDHRMFKMPLGWQLSGRTADLIAHQVGSPSQCMTGEPFVRLSVKLVDYLFEHPPREDTLTSGLVDEAFSALVGNWCAQCELIRLARGTDGDGGDYPCRP